MRQICTHDGVFHGDDVLAGAIVHLFHPDAAIARTRSPGQLATADLCFDVGYGPYDHHQPGGNGVRPNGVPYASAGLLWRDYGASICESNAVAVEVDRQLIQSIDAHDNGFQIAAPTSDAIPCTISHVLSDFNPSWEETQDFDARYVVQQTIKEAHDPRIVELPYFVPWQEALVEQSTDALFCVYPSAGSWRVQIVPVTPGQPGARLALPEAWAGLEADALRDATGVADATFAHRGRFIAGAATRTGALALARLALVKP